MLRYRSMALAGLLAISAPVAGRAQGSFDGTWVGRGTLTQARHQGARCGEPERNGRLTVQGGVLSWDYSTRDGVRFSGPVAADGRFDIVSGPHRFHGRFSPTGMTAQYVGSACERAWGFRRQSGR